jgi:hypothetical protein
MSRVVVALSGPSNVATGAGVHLIAVQPNRGEIPRQGAAKSLLPMFVWRATVEELCNRPATADDDPAEVGKMRRL